MSVEVYGRCELCGAVREVRESLAAGGTTIELVCPMAELAGADRLCHQHPNHRLPCSKCAGFDCC